MGAAEALIPRKTLLAGVIYFNQRRQTARCIIRELSAESATLICEDANAVPTNTIELYLPSKSVFYPAVIKERHGVELCVALTGHEANAISSDIPVGVLQRLEVLEGEVRKLRQMLNQMRTTAGVQSQEQVI